MKPKYGYDENIRFAFLLTGTLPVARRGLYHEYVEITTSGYVFKLNFTNAAEILENRFISRTISSGKRKFRWGFTISRKFSLWRDKSK
jgi:hypothetical protein